jgi:hypothetical protein
MTTKAKTEVELHPDAWERFERALKAVAKAPPQHRVKEKPKAKKAAGKRRRAKAD